MIKTICKKLMDNKIGIIEHDTLPGIVSLATKRKRIKNTTTQRSAGVKRIHYLNSMH